MTIRFPESIKKGSTGNFHAGTYAHFRNTIKLLSKKSGTELDQILSLSENSFLRYFSFAVLYFAQGIPQGLLFFALPAWFAMNGKTPMEIAQFIAVVSVPWSFKVIAAPLLDRFTYLPMGRRRPWLLFGQFGLVIGFVVMALIPDPLNQLISLMICGFFLSFFGIIQDISIDSMAIDLLPEDQQARANGLMWGAKAVGVSVTVATTSLLIGIIGFFMSVLIFALIAFIILLLPIYLKERPIEKRFPWSKGRIAKSAVCMQLDSTFSIFKSLFRVFFLPASLFLVMAAFSISVGRGMIDATLPVFTVHELGWSDTHYSQVFALTNMLAGVLGMFLGGAIIDFWGKLRMIGIFLIMLILVLIGMAMMDNFWQHK